MSSTTLIKAPCGCEILDVLDTNGERYLRIEGCKEHPLAQGDKGSAWAIVNYIKQVEAENEILFDALVHCGYDPSDCIDCGGPPHNEYCRFWKLRDVLPFDMVLTAEESG